ncbi:MAG: leucine-rich repeat domain-containing protein [Clostridia bacterium]|nr:leucine-rich repeat domain-containing protein [Clostridia bacterium]
MRKEIVCICILIFIFPFCFCSSAENVYTKDYSASILPDGTLKIFRYKGIEKNLIIPNIIEGRKVTAIGKEAFSFQPITNITIPENITNIEESAFHRCSSLKSVTFLGSVSKLDSNPFLFCENLSQIVVAPDHPTLAVIDGVLFYKPEKRLIFYPQTKLSSIYSIPEGILSIGNYAFFECNNLSSIIIPDTVKEIGYRAFSSCERIENLNIPDSVVSIGDYAFQGCQKLSSIDIPDSLTTIGKAVFSGCHSLLSIVIPDSVTTIGDYAFAECDSVLSISIPKSITTIGNYVFSGCTNITSISIPDSLTSLGANPFKNCAKLEKIQVSSMHPTLELIDGVLFYKPEKRLLYYPISNSALSYNIPQGTLSIGDSSFASCDNLTDVLIANSVLTIGDYAFVNCKGLTNIFIPDGVTNIGEMAFFNCKKLNSITIPDNIISIGDCAFELCEFLTALTIPENVEYIGTDAFYKCTNLTLTVVRDSYAEAYCKENSLNYIYTDSFDWLSN